MKRNYFICVIGLDGSGKTTLAKKIIEILNNNNIDGVYTWGGYRLYLLWPIIKIGKLIFLKDDCMYKDYNRYSDSIKCARKISSVSFLYQSLTLFEYYLQILIKIKLPLMIGKTIVSDRYIYDTVISVATVLNYSDDKFKGMLSRLSRYCPKPDIVFYIDIPADMAFKRKNDIPDIKYLELRHKYYRLIDNLISINGDQNINSINEELRDRLNYLLKDN